MRPVFCALALLLCIPVASARGAAIGIVLASWNVENLFDTVDDPANPGDDPYSLGGWQHWSSCRYQLKLEHLAGIIARIKPQILCLMEVENRQVVQELSDVLRNKYAYELPVIIHRDSTDPRGIDVAILAARPPSSVEWLCPTNALRDTIAATFDWDGRELTVLANHWKSQLGDKAESDMLRTLCAKTVRAYLDKRLAANPTAAIVVAGDFNDDPCSPLLTETAGFAMDARLVRTNAAHRLFFNLASTIPEPERYTYYYAPSRSWGAMDMMHVSAGMLDGSAPWRFPDGGYRIINDSDLRFPPVGAPLPFRRVRGKAIGDIYLTGFSDHFPIRLLLQPSSR